MNICVKLDFFSFHSSYGVLVTDYDGTLFKTYVTISRTYPQNEIERSVKYMMDFAISHMGYPPLAKLSSAFKHPYVQGPTTRSLYTHIQ